MTTKTESSVTLSNSMYDLRDKINVIKDLFYSVINKTSDKRNKSIEDILAEAKELQYSANIINNDLLTCLDRTEFILYDEAVVLIQQAISLFKTDLCKYAAVQEIVVDIEYLFLNRDITIDSMTCKELKHKVDILTLIYNLTYKNYTDDIRWNTFLKLCTKNKIDSGWVQCMINYRNSNEFPDSYKIKIDSKINYLVASCIKDCADKLMVGVEDIIIKPRTNNNIT